MSLETAVLTKSSANLNTTENTILTWIGPHVACDKVLDPVKYTFLQRLTKHLPNADMFVYMTFNDM